jgi:hypothetical protein
MVKIAFWDNCLCERGTTIALYDYALFNITILGNESVILYNPNNPNNNDEVIEKFSKEFSIYGVANNSELDSLLESTGCDIVYIIKAGDPYDGRISKTKKSVIHCVFTCYTPHGDVYASVSPSVKGNNGTYPVVPHIVYLPEHGRNLRQQLNIPENVVVFGRYGGYDQFDIGYVKQIVSLVAKISPNIYFLFANTAPFCEPLPNIIHLSKIIDLDTKSEFINTCDAMLWARSDGETFGLSIAEFSVLNKPVLATNIGDTAHVYYLGDKGIWYNESNLYDILTQFKKEDYAKGDWNAYRDYSPEKVMDIFKRVFIDN